VVKLIKENRYEKSDKLEIVFYMLLKLGFNCLLSMKCKFLFLFLITFTLYSVFSDGLEIFIERNTINILRNSNEPITALQQKNSGLSLMPQHEKLKILVNESRRNLEPNILAEALYLYPKPEKYAGLEWSDSDKLGIFNQMTAMSTLSGIQYYSASQKTMRVFYESSYVTDGLANQKKLPDPVFNNLPETFGIYARQKDLTFGENNYRYDYLMEKDAMF